MPSPKAPSASASLGRPAEQRAQPARRRRTGSPSSAGSARGSARRHVRAPGVGPLHQLPAGERGRGVRERAHRVLAARGRQLGEGAREEQVAGRGRRQPAAPRRTRSAGRGAAARGRARRRARAWPCGAAPPPPRPPRAARPVAGGGTGTPASAAGACRPRTSVPAAWRSSSGAVARQRPRPAAPRCARAPWRARARRRPAPLRAGPVRCSRAGCPAWIAMMPPAVSTQRTSVEARGGQLGRPAPRGPGKRRTELGQVGVGVRVARRAGRARGTTLVEPDPEEPGQRRLLRRGDLEHHHAAARPRDARHLGEPARRGRRSCGRRSPP